LRKFKQFCETKSERCVKSDPSHRSVARFFSGADCNWVFIVCLMLFFLTAFLGCDSSDEAMVVNLNDRADKLDSGPSKPLVRAENEFYFGFDLRGSPREDAGQYLPFLSYLERETGYKFKLRFNSKSKPTEEELGMGITHFAAIGMMASIRATEKYGAIPLVHGLNAEGKAKYRSMIVVAPDSNIHTLDDLRGKRFAFGAKNSTQGYLLPLINLSQKGILNSLHSKTFSGSHWKCADMVVSGKADACGMQDTMAKLMTQQGLLRILHTSDYCVSSGITVNKDVPPQVIKKVKQALLDFDPKGRHKKYLHNWDNTEMPNGFVPHKEKDHEFLNDWMIKLRLLGSTDSKAGQQKTS